VLLIGSTRSTTQASAVETFCGNVKANPRRFRSPRGLTFYLAEQGL
jgi:hypothetical protein